MSGVERCRPGVASAEVAARAGHGSRADVLASAVGYWSPEIAATAAFGGGGAWLLHPAALPVAGALLAVRIAAARIARHRAQYQQTQRAERAVCHSNETTNVEDTNARAEDRAGGPGVWGGIA